MINDDVLVYAEESGLEIKRSSGNVCVEGDGIYLEVYGESATNFATFLNTPGLVDFLRDVDKTRKDGFGVANTLALMAKAKILFA